MAKTIGRGAIERTISGVNAPSREAKQHIGVHHRFGQGAQLGILRETLLVRIHAFVAAFVNHAFGVHRVMFSRFTPRRT